MYSMKADEVIELQKLLGAEASKTQQSEEKPLDTDQAQETADKINVLEEQLKNTGEMYEIQEKAMVSNAAKVKQLTTELKEEKKVNA